MTDACGQISGRLQPSPPGTARARQAGMTCRPWREPTDKGPASPLVRLISAQLASGIPDEIARAQARIALALVRHGGNRTRAAEDLGVPLRTLQRWISLAPDAYRHDTIVIAETSTKPAK